MPVLSMFFGIIVRMYQEAGRKHNVPHIHAEYSGDEVVVALDGTVLEGAIPKSKMKLLEAWMRYTGRILKQIGNSFPMVNSFFALIL